MTGAVRHRFIHHLTHGMSTRVWAPAVLLVVLMNSFSRSWAWNYEWLWAMDTLSFSSIFLVPLCAGIAAYEAGGLAVARDLHLVSPRSTWAVVRVGAGVWVVTAVMILLSFLIISVYVLYQTSGLIPRPADFLPIPLLLVIVAVGCSVGVLVGWCLPSRLTPGLTALGVFALMMSAYIVGRGAFSGLVSVGSATGSLVGLKLSLRLVLWQCLFYGMLILGLVWLVRMRTTLSRWRHRGLAVVCAVAIVVVGGGVLGAGERFVSAPVGERVCEGSEPRICLFPGYSAHSEEMRAELDPYLKALRQAGVEVPGEVVQVEAPTDSDAVQVGSLDVLDFDDQRIINALVDWYSGDDCAGWGSQRGRGEDPSAIVWDWMALRVDGVRMYHSSNVEWGSMSAEQQDEVFREAIERLSTECREH